MNKKSKLPKWVWVSLLIPLLILLYFADNIKGQVRFMQYCWKEGGLKVYEPLERDVGWEAEDYYYAKVGSLLDGVGFVRYFDSKENNYFDVEYIGGNVQHDTSFKKQPSDFEREIQYVWKIDVKRLEGETRLTRTSYEVLGFGDKSLKARYYRFSYSQFNPDKSFGPSGVSCFWYPTGDERGWRKSINTAFKN